MSSSPAITTAAQLQHNRENLLKAEIDKIFQAVTKDNLESLIAEEDTFDFSTLRNDIGDTLLHVAIREDSSQCLHYLIEKIRMSLNVQNNQGKTPIDIAISSERTLLKSAKTKYHRINKLISYGATDHTLPLSDSMIYLLLTAALGENNINHVKIFSFLLNKPFNKINELDSLDKGSTLLHKLFEKLSRLGEDTTLEILKILLAQKNIDVTITNTDNLQPIHIIYNNKQALAISGMLQCYMSERNLQMSPLPQSSSTEKTSEKIGTAYALFSIHTNSWRRIPNPVKNPTQKTIHKDVSAVASVGNFVELDGSKEQDNQSDIENISENIQLREGHALFFKAESVNWQNNTNHQSLSSIQQPMRNSLFSTRNVFG